MLPWIITAIFALISFVLLLFLKRTNSQREGLEPTSSALLHRITKQLDALDSIGAQVEGLDRAFRIPRTRGGFGETLLEELLRSWLPQGSWSTQYPFPNGTRVDAIIRMGSKLVPVDAKFPLERLEHWLRNEGKGIPGEVRRTILGHAQSIAQKYIRPEDGTLSFALMYFPAENLHYRVLTDDDGSLMRECLELHVLPVGPMSLFAYLQTVAFGLRGLALPAQGRELRKHIERIRRDVSALERPLTVASTHLKNLNKCWEEIERKRVRLEAGMEEISESPPKK
ncbi:MAG: DNA recombination protein RmuC [Spirochaetales bacterium]|nr:DNA recombination protein RmuC [Spirochaetales bacterium]